jgi:hypothetical protein
MGLVGLWLGLGLWLGPRGTRIWCLVAGAATAAAGVAIPGALPPFVEVSRVPMNRWTRSLRVDSDEVAADDRKIAHSDSPVGRMLLYVELPPYDYAHLVISMAGMNVCIG